MTFSLYLHLEVIGFPKLLRRLWKFDFRGVDNGPRLSRMIYISQRDFSLKSSVSFPQRSLYFSLKPNSMFYYSNHNCVSESIIIKLLMLHNVIYTSYKLQLCIAVILVVLQRGLWPINALRLWVESFVSFLLSLNFERQLKNRNQRKRCTIVWK